MFHSSLPTATMSWNDRCKMHFGLGSAEHVDFDVFYSYVHPQDRNATRVAPKLLPRIFDLFTRADQSLERSQGGLGIGLSLVKTMVELHGGWVEAQSEGSGKGSEFIVRLPLVEAEVPGAQADPETDPATADERPRRVLIVEDNIDSAESLRMLLELDGHDARCVYDGVAALELATSFEPDVAILDLGLPQMNGFELAQRLRELPQTSQSLLVALTGYGQSEDKRRTEAAGFDHHLVKPVDPEQLSALVGSAPMRDTP